jgi:hypothetical protein
MVSSVFDRRTCFFEAARRGARGQACEAEGRRLGTQVLRPSDNGEIAAKKILREKHDKHSEFYAPIRYLN